MPPDLVTAKLGLMASKIVSKGPMQEPICADHFRIGKLNAWFLESEARVESRDPQKHVDWFLDEVVPNCTDLRSRLELPADGPYGNPSARVEITHWIDEDGYLRFSPDDLLKLGSLNIPVDFSFADYGNEG